MIQGVFDKRRFLDLLRYFIVFEDFGGGAVAKKIAGTISFMRSTLQCRRRCARRACGRTPKSGMIPRMATRHQNSRAADRETGGSVWYGTLKGRGRVSPWLSMRGG